MSRLMRNTAFFTAHDLCDILSHQDDSHMKVLQAVGACTFTDRQDLLDKMTAAVGAPLGVFFMKSRGDLSRG